MSNGDEKKSVISPNFSFSGMSSTFVIQLTSLRFVAAHGLYEQEAQVGGEFEVNLSLTIPAPEHKRLSIDDTVNYADVHAIVKEIFTHRQALLETIAMEIVDVIKNRFPALRKISVQIIKLHPPIAAFTGSVSITLNKKFKT
jgi:dihydroneopterin aldolase